MCEVYVRMHGKEGGQLVEKDMSRTGGGESAGLGHAGVFERTDGRQAFFDAVTGEHIDTLNPGFYG